MKLENAPSVVRCPPAGAGPGLQLNAKKESPRGLSFFDLFLLRAYFCSPQPEQLAQEWLAVHSLSAVGVQLAA